MLAPVVSGIKERFERWDWEELKRSLDANGFAKTPPLLSSEECSDLIECYTDDNLFRSKVEMARYQFGSGEYKYFAAPLPDLIEQLRSNLYAYLAPVANAWLSKSSTVVSNITEFPASLAEFLEYCHSFGQTKPTPLILKYEAGDYNCLHQDLYGEIAFPLQVVFGLSKREQDYSGGELLLVEQRPRAQSCGKVITLEQGQALIFPNRYRPVASKTGCYRTNMKHGVSALHWGTRYSLGIIFHDAK